MILSTMDVHSGFYVTMKYIANVTATSVLSYVQNSYIISVKSWYLTHALLCHCDLYSQFCTHYFLLIVSVVTTSCSLEASWYQVVLLIYILVIMPL